jgi:hypothetical protein
MAVKETQNKRPMTIEELRAVKDKKFTGKLWDHPQGYGTLELARLTRSEREQIQKATNSQDGMRVSVDVALQNRMAAAFGLVSPKMTAEELLEWPDDYIEPIAEEVWRMSNDYKDVNRTGDGEVPAPFSKTSNFATGSPTDGSDSPAKSPN